MILALSHIVFGGLFFGDCMKKVCTKCKRGLPLDNFHKNKNSKDGLCCWCKDCTKASYEKNREKRLQYQKDYKKSDEERFREQQKRWKSQNKEKVSRQRRIYEEENKEVLSEYRKRYFLKNREKILSYNCQYLKGREKTDHLFAFKKRVRGLIRSSFGRKGLKKNKNTTDILGCSFEELQKHLYKTFFENYGYQYDGKEPVHIDHIIPLATAKTEQDVIRLCHFTNLQLLKPTDNLKKSAKM